VAFQKVPAVLAGLRRRLGEERFFRGFRAAIRDGRGGPAAYDGFRRAFEEAAGESLDSFFDSWFFRAGFPKVEASWKAGEVDGKPGYRILLRQVQEGPPFEADFDVLVRTAGGQESRRPVSMRTREKTIPWDLPSPPEAIVVDPDETSLVRQVESP
jgi:aminopeptidase N